MLLESKQISVLLFLLCVRSVLFALCYFKATLHTQYCSGNCFLFIETEILCGS